MRLFPLLLIALLPAVSQASVIRLEQLSIDYGRYHPSARLPAMPGFPPKERLALNMDVTTVWDLIGWETTVHASTDTGQYRLVGLRFFLCVRFPPRRPWLKFGWKHHSRHLMEAAHPLFKFPVEDLVEARIQIYP